jgi:hypothetical protein
MTPDGVHEVVQHGATVLVETSADRQVLALDDAAHEKAGASICGSGGQGVCSDGFNRQDLRCAWRPGSYVRWSPLSEGQQGGVVSPFVGWCAEVVLPGRLAVLSDSVFLMLGAKRGVVGGGWNGARANGI